MPNNPDRPETTALKRRKLSPARRNLLRGLASGGIIKTDFVFSYPAWEPAGARYEGYPSCQTVRAAAADGHIAEDRSMRVIRPHRSELFYRITDAGLEALANGR